MNFPDKWAAVVWMCRNQLGRRNLNSRQQAKLFQEEHDAIAKSVGAQAGNTNKNQSGVNDQIDSKSRTPTRTAVAGEHGVSESYVKEAVEFGRGLDAAEKVSPGIKDAVLSGEVKAPIAENQSFI